MIEARIIPQIQADKTSVVSHQYLKLFDSLLVY